MLRDGLGLFGVFWFLITHKVAGLAATLVQSIILSLFIILFLILNLSDSRRKT